MEVGGERTITIRTRVAAGTAGRTLTNVAAASPDAAETNAANNAQNASVLVVEAPPEPTPTPTPEPESSPTPEPTPAPQPAAPAPTPPPVTVETACRSQRVFEVRFRERAGRVVRSARVAGKGVASPSADAPTAAGSPRSTSAACPPDATPSSSRPRFATANA